MPSAGWGAGAREKLLRNYRAEKDSRRVLLVEFSNNGNRADGPDEIDIEIGVDEVLCH
jgi:hypothetical protein